MGAKALIQRKGGSIKIPRGAGKKARPGKGGTALVIGRFQPMHSGHVEAIREILGRHKKMILIIGSAQEGRTPKNPFSGIERKEMIIKCLMAKGLMHRCKIVLLPDENNHPRWVSRIIWIAGKANVVYSGNWLVQSLLKPNYQVHVMRSGIEISATAIRGMIRRHDSRWKKFVPKEIKEYIEANGLEKVV